MTLKFLYITTDPFVNNSEEFVRILAISNLPGVSTSSGIGIYGQLKDQNGKLVTQLAYLSETVTTSSTAYPYAVASFFQAIQIIIIPPGWSFASFGSAIAVQGSLEEVLRVH